VKERSASQRPSTRSARRGPLVREIITTLLDNYGVFTFNAADRQCVRGLSSGRPQHDDAGRARAKDRNGGYISAFAQDDFRIHSRVTLNLGLRYDVQFPFTDPTTASSPSCRGGSPPSLDGSRGTLFRYEGVSRGIVRRRQQSPPASAWRGIEGDGRTRSARRSACSTQHHGQRVEHHRRTTSPSRSGSRSPPYYTLPIRIAIFPEGRVRSRSLTAHGAAVHIAGAGIRAVAWISSGRSPTGETSRSREKWPQLQRERVVHRGVRPTSRGSVDNNYPVSGLAAPPERQRAAAVSARDDRRCDVLSSIFAALQRPPVRRRAPWLARVRQAYYSFAAATKMSIFRAAGCRESRSATRLWRRTRSEFETIARTASSCRAFLEGRLHEGRGVARAHAGPDCRLRDRDPAVGAAAHLGAGQDRNLDGLTNDRADLVGNASSIAAALEMN